MRNIFKAALVAGVAVVAATSAAHATIIPLGGNLTIWSADTPGSSYGSPNQTGSATNPLAQTTALFSGTYAGPLDFLDPIGGVNTIGSSGSPVTGLQCVGRHLGPRHHTHHLPLRARLAVRLQLHAGQCHRHQHHAHDGGISIWHSGNTTDLVDSANPTTDLLTTFPLGAGSYRRGLIHTRTQAGHGGRGEEARAAASRAGSMSGIFTVSAYCPECFGISPG